jgi:hypothetical protein
MAFFEEGSEAFTQLEGYVDTVGIRNVIFALAKICDLKSEHLAVNWQDTKTAKVWARWSHRFESMVGAHLDDPLAR